MYEFIQGKLAEITPASAVLETAGGVGYCLNISLQTYSVVAGQPDVRLYTHFIVREDVQILYGFATRDERELFRLLIGVSGGGGNTARMILSASTSEELRAIIATGKAEVLKSDKGLGLKTAQKIIVELKDKVTGGTGGTVALPAGTPAAGSPLYDEALAALTMLGFAKSASEKVLRELIRETPGASVEEVIRQALKKL